MADLVSATRFLTDVTSRTTSTACGPSTSAAHLPTTTTVEVSRLATHARCKIEITAIAVTERLSDGDARLRRARGDGQSAGAAPARPAGHQVVGWNRTPDKARDLVAAGLTLAKSPRAAAEGVEAVFTMVTDDAALRAVALGADGVIAGLGRRRHAGRDEHGEPGGRA